MVLKFLDKRELLDKNEKDKLDGNLIVASSIIVSVVLFIIYCCIFQYMYNNIVEIYLISCLFIILGFAGPYLLYVCIIYLYEIHVLLNNKRME